MIKDIVEFDGRATHDYGSDRLAVVSSRGKTGTARINFQFPGVLDIVGASDPGQIGKDVTSRYPKSDDVVRQAVLSHERLHIFLRDKRLPKLWHAWKEVMLDLKVQVPAEPIVKCAGVNVYRRFKL